MPYDGIYKIQNYASLNENEYLPFPLATHIVPAGQHGTLNFHEHDSIEIAIVTEGKGIHILNERKACVRKGDVIIIYPNSLHAYDDTKTLGVLNILYNSERMAFPAIDGYEIPLYAKFFPLEKILPEAQSPEPILHIDSDETINAIIKDSLMLMELLKEPTQGKLLQITVKFLDT
ncbi:MAG: AraC family ligand binding domain-containing protein, partial [Lentisphaeria bacterium]|nr:AraC family ligand binding domain-containing protein [Lentisphaeria bacterium]